MNLSIVIPCFNEEEVIFETVRQLKKFSDGLSDFETELIFVDDGSTDLTFEILNQFSIDEPRIKIIKFARNFGHQVAVSAGIDVAEGDAVVLIDADLQDPIEVVHTMIKKWQEGFDVVYGTRLERMGESNFKIATARAFYRLLNRMSEVPMPLDTGDFRLMSRKVVEVLKEMPERDRFIRGMVSWIGFNQTAVTYDRRERYAGVSKYPLRKMVRLAMDGLISFSTKPLQISVGLGIVSTLFAIVGILYAVIIRIFTNNWVGGWATIMVSILFFGGVQLLSIGIIGEYIGRIYGQVQSRPLYVVSEYVGFRPRQKNKIKI